MAASVNLVVVLGPTASGKTRLAVQLARLLGSSVISADSRQVYRGMDLGTGKDLAEYGEVPCHLIDIRDAGEEYNVFAFQRDFFDCFERLRTSGEVPVLCGGTGMYLDAVLRGYRLVEVPENPQLRRELAERDDEALRTRLRELRPELHNRTDLEERPRLIRAIEIALGEREAGAGLPPLPEVRPLVFGLRWDRPVLRKRIAARLRERLEAGMIAEVEGLLAKGVTLEALEFYGLEYRFVARHLQGELSRNDMTQKLATAIGQYAKRQETWFRRMERQGTQILWLDGSGNPLEEALPHLRRSDLLPQQP